MYSQQWQALGLRHLALTQFLTFPPKPAQAKMLVPWMKRTDISAVGNVEDLVTGAAIGIIDCINYAYQTTQVIAVAPDYLKAGLFFGKYVNEFGVPTGARSFLCTEDIPFEVQYSLMDNDIRHILVGTTGRLAELVARGLETNHVHTLVLLEVDSILQSPSSQALLSDIVCSLDSNVQIVTVSSNLSPLVKEFGYCCLKKPVAFVRVP